VLTNNIEEKQRQVSHCNIYEYCNERPDNMRHAAVWRINRVRWQLSNRVYQTEPGGCGITPSAITLTLILKYRRYRSVSESTGALKSFAEICSLFQKEKPPNPLARRY
jgi:hypothetical protein